jgi:hypothetical protein
VVWLSWPSPHITVTFVVRLSWPNPHIIVTFVVRLSWPNPQNTHASYVSRCSTFMLHPTAQIRMVWPSILDSRPCPPPHAQSKREKLDLYCCIAARAKPMGRQWQTAQMKLMFVRWFGRPFWTHTDVHLLVYTHCSLDGSAVHFGLPPRFTHRFLVYIQRKARLVLLHRSASQNQWVDSIRLPE